MEVNELQRSSKYLHVSQKKGSHKGLEQLQGEQRGKTFIFGWIISLNRSQGENVIKKYNMTSLTWESSESEHMMMALETITMQKLFLELKVLQESQSPRHARFAGSEDILFQEQ